MEVKKIKPSNADLILRDPISKKILAKEGELKSITTYWQRRLLAGEVVVVVDEVKTIVTKQKKGEE
jgi:hypothetical protein